MLLRASGQRENRDFNLNAVNEADSDPGVDHAGHLRRLTEAAIGGRWRDLAAVRDEAAAAMGEQAMVDALTVAAGFNGITRVADATGIPLDPTTHQATGSLRVETGIDAFDYAAKSTRYDRQQTHEATMSIIGIEEIFLDVQDLARAVDFYEGVVGLPVVMRNDERAYLQCERSHVVLQVKGHGGRHRGGGPMHFSFTVAEDVFDEVAQRAAKANIFTRGPMGERGKGRALFMLDPDGNEAEVNTRYLYGVPKR